MKKRLNIQMLIVTLCIAIPMIAIFVFLEINHNNEIKKEIIVSAQANVQSKMNEIDIMLENARESLLFLTVESNELDEIGASAEKNSELWIAISKVINKLSNQNMINKLNLTPYVYFPAQEIFINSDVDSRICAYIIDQVLTSPGGSRYEQTWNTVNIEGTNYIYLLMKCGRYFIGAWGQYSNCFDCIDFGNNEQYLFLNNEGEVLNGEETLDSGAFAQYSSSTQADFTLELIPDPESVRSQLSPIYINLIIVLLVFILLFTAYILFINRWVMKPIKHLRSNMDIIRKGDLQHRIQKIPSSSMEIDEVIGDFNHLMDDLESAKISMYEKEIEQNEVRLEYLSRQIQPHFILNTLNTLYLYNENDPESVRSIIKLISQYYRYVINVNSKYVNLENELKHIDNYLKLQMLRYPEAFAYEIVCDEQFTKFQVLPFVLESFVGNCFKHGLLVGGHSKILINVSEKDEWLVIRIEDNGPGFSDDSLDAIKEFLDDGIISDELGVVIRNSVERMKLIYGDDCEVRAFNKEEGGAVVEILIKREWKDGNQGNNN